MKHLNIFICLLAMVCLWLTNMSFQNKLMLTIWFDAVLALWSLSKPTVTESN